jgi:hypothetical protein
MNDKLLPMYTCLCYFDNASLEVIPQSHINKNIPSSESYNRKIQLHMSRGDILIFHSNLHHRGIGYGTGNRRLLQVFEVFPNKSIYDRLSKQLITVKSSDSIMMKYIISPFMYQMAKNNMIDYVTYIHYVLMYNDFHQKIGMVDIPPWLKKGKYVTYEAGPRLDLDEIAKDNYIAPINKNIIVDKSIYTTTSSFYFYLFIIILICIIIIYFVLCKFNIKKVKRRTKR